MWLFQNPSSGWRFFGDVIFTNVIVRYCFNFRCHHHHHSYNNAIFLQAGCCIDMVVLLVTWKRILLLPGDLKFELAWSPPQIMAHLWILMTKVCSPPTFDGIYYIIWHFLQNSESTCYRTLSLNVINSTTTYHPSDSRGWNSRGCQLGFSAAWLFSGHGIISPVFQLTWVSIRWLLGWAKSSFASTAPSSTLSSRLTLSQPW